MITLINLLLALVVDPAVVSFLAPGVARREGALLLHPVSVILPVLNLERPLQNTKGIAYF